MDEKGLVLVHTGDGKGKTSAAIGLCVRALGNNKKVCVIQFIKSPEVFTGEREFLEKNNVEIYCMGVGFTFKNTDEQNREALKKAWDLTVQKINDSTYNLIILDEINYALDIENFKTDDIFNVTDLIELLKTRNKKQNVVLTGRNAKKELMDFADLVTEMKCIKHYYDKGVKATPGIEF